MINLKDSPYLSIFRELDTTSLQHFTIRELNPKDVLINANSLSGMDLYLVLKGVCLISRATVTHTPWISTPYRIGPGDFVGLSEVISPTPLRRESTVTAKTPVSILCIEQQEFLRWQIAYPKLYNKIISRVLRKQFYLRDMLYHCASAPALNAGAGFLHYLYLLYRDACYSPAYQGPVSIQENRQDLSHAIARNIRSVDRVLSTLDEKNMITLQHGSISIDAAQAARLAELEISGLTPLKE